MRALASRIAEISIHALRGEGDSGRTRTFRPSDLFQSTPSVGRATALTANPHRAERISIHALRGEGDFQGSADKLKDAISIHALRGEGDLFRALRIN